MNAKTKALSEEARKLSREERIALIEDLQNSLDPIDAEIERAWAEEARDRLADYLRGEMDAKISFRSTPNGERLLRKA
jgi:putative addiction module component (TIGR02574 family)